MLPPGATLAQFRILSSLGSGGMGEVYLAEDTRLGRRVAVKILPAEMAQAQVSTIRLRLLKIGARVVFSARRAVVSMSSAYPPKHLFGQVWAALRC